MDVFGQSPGFTGPEGGGDCRVTVAALPEFTTEMSLANAVLDSVAAKLVQ
jgi:hypothetical protein